MEKEIEVGNKMIAEFLGWTYDYSGINWAVPITNDLIPELTPDGNYISGTRLPDDKLRFHTSWDWLMPVVEKIGDTRLKATASYNPDLMFKVEICTGYTKIEGTHQVIFHNASKDGMLTATYKAVLSFIKWYNEQNK